MSTASFVSMIWAILWTVGVLAVTTMVWAFVGKWKLLRLVAVQSIVLVTGVVGMLLLDFFDRGVAALHHMVPATVCVAIWLTGAVLLARRVDSR